MKQPVAALALAGVAAMLSTNPVQANDKAKSTAAVPTIFQAVADCQAIVDSPVRLACYDETVARLSEAQSRKEVYIADKADVEATRKSLFGFSLSDIRIFGDGDYDALKQLDAKITDVALAANGRYVFRLDSGSRWQQLDDVATSRPRAGNAVSIRKGPLGGYMAKVEGGRAFRVQRLPS